VTGLVFSRTQKQLSYKIMTFKSSIKCVYIRTKMGIKFKIQNIEFFKRIVGGQLFLFLDLVAGFMFAFLCFKNRFLIAQYVEIIVDYVGGFIANVDLIKHIPFGIKPDFYIYKLWAQADYIFLLVFSEALFVLKGYLIYIIWAIIISSTCGFSIGVGLVIDIYGFLWYPFKVVHCINYAMSVELMTYIKHLWRIAVGQRWNPNDDRIEQYEYDPLCRLVCVPIVLCM
jgi:hypothetical protein